MGFIDEVKTFAENVLKRCRDRYGPKSSPLLVDSIDLETGEPERWEGHVLSNLARQMNFLRTLDALHRLTGERIWRERAEEWIGYALEELQDETSGLLYWGGHSSYDLLRDEPLIGCHELKCVYPHYPFLYEVNPGRTRRLIEAFWNLHVVDWSTLLFNRHGGYKAWDETSPWDHEYRGGPVPIIDNKVLSFINTGSDLIYAGASLSALSGDPKPLTWAKRLLKRYDEIRHEKTGLGGYQFNHREPCRVRISFKKPLGDRPDVNETTVITNGVILTRYGRVAVTLLNLFETLGPAEGREFLEFVRKDLTALAEYSYDFSERTFTPLLYDGTRLSPSDCYEDVGYCRPGKLRKVPANGLMFLAYAKAFRLTGEELLKRVALSLLEGIKRPEERGADEGAYLVFGLLELYGAEGGAYLKSALRLGRELSDRFFIDGFFTVDGHRVSLNSTLPLALLHLENAGGDGPVELPAFYPSTSGFDPKVIIARRGR